MKDWLSRTFDLGVSNEIKEFEVVTINGSDGGASKEMKLTIRIGSTTCTASEVPVKEPTPRLTLSVYSTSTSRARGIVNASVYE